MGHRSSPPPAWDDESFTLGALPAGLPLVVLADHGIRENRSGGPGHGRRYRHGGLSLEESVIPLATFGSADDRGPAG